MVVSSSANTTGRPQTDSPGSLCVVEGIDGSGKSTLLASLVSALRGDGLALYFGDRFRRLLELREPTTGPVGRKLRAHLQAGDQLTADAWLKLFFADRAENVTTNIAPALANGDLVVQDRYFYSTAAYQGSSPEHSQQIVSNSLTAGFPEPNIILYLDIQPEAAMRRIIQRESQTTENKKSLESFETLEQLKRIHANYDRVLPDHTLRLDAEQSPEAIREAALSHIQLTAN